MIGMPSGLVPRLVIVVPGGGGVGPVSMRSLPVSAAFAASTNGPMDAGPRLEVPGAFAAMVYESGARPLTEYPPKAFEVVRLQLPPVPQTCTNAAPSSFPAVALLRNTVPLIEPPVGAVPLRTLKT